MAGFEYIRNAIRISQHSGCPAWYAQPSQFSRHQLGILDVNMGVDETGTDKLPSGVEFVGGCKMIPRGDGSDVSAGDDNITMEYLAGVKGEDVAMPDNERWRTFTQGHEP